MKAELRELVNTMRMVLPINAVAQAAYTIQFGEQDKAGIIYPNIDLLVIKANIIGVTVHRLLGGGGDFCNIFFKKTLDEICDFLDYVEPCEHMVRGWRCNRQASSNHSLSYKININSR